MTCVVGVKALIDGLMVSVAMNGPVGSKIAYNPGQIISYVMFVLMVVVAWKGAEFLESYIKENHEQTIKLNRIWVVILSVYYINYYLNNLDRKFALARMVEKVK
jgi:hypothetical protein